MRRGAYAAIALCLILVINTAVATRMDEAESEAEANRWFFSSWFSSGQAAVQTDDRALNAVLKIFGLEAGCRNNSDDLMNQFEGRTGYTCYGINPQSGWNSKDLYPNCGSCQRDKVLFTQCCHNLDPEAFKRNSAKVFVRNYFSPGGCNDLPPAAYFVCGHIALWSGTGRSTQWVKELGPCGRGCNEKEYCNKLNEKHREFLQKVASTEKTEKQKEKHRAWFQKIDDRKRECDNVGSDGSQQQQQGPEKKHTPPTQEQLDAAANIANAVTEAANKAAERLSKDEGPCQNQKDDPANAFLASSESSVGSQSTGWTCLGLSAQNAWERRQLFPECVDCGSNPTDFGKCCHDKNPSAFAKAAKSALVSGLFTPAGCLDLPWPALYACASVAATGSVSIAAAIRKELGPCFPGNGCNVKEFCHKFNNKHKAQWQTSVKGDPKSGAHTEAHQKRHEARARACDEAPASAPFPSASNQTETLKPSDPIPVTVVTGGGSSIPDLGNEPVMKALRSILAHEMDCHNIATDRGNKMANKLGFTCLGLAPSVGWHWRSYFPECDQACNKDPVMFVKCCRDHDPIKFFINAARVYKENYWAQSGCSNLAFPAAHICLDIAINTGTGRAKHYIHEMGPCPASGAVVPSKTHQQSLQPAGPCDAVKYCMEMNEKHKELYVRIPQVDGVQQPFLQGWLDRYEDRKKVCNGQDPVNSQAEAAVQQALAPLTEHAEHADTNGEKCAALGGKCLSTKMPCNGQFVDASHAPCPSSSRCCVPPAPSQQTNLPPPPPSGPQQTQTTGGHPQQQQNADDGVQDVVNPGGNHGQQHVQQHHQQQQQQPQKPSESTRETLKTGYQGPTAPVFEGGDPGKGLCGEYAKSAKEVAVVTGVLGKKFAVVKALPVHLEEPSIRSKKVEEEDNSMEVHTACAFSTMAAEAKSDRFNVRIKIKKGFRVASRGEEVHGNGLALDFNIDCGAQNESLPSRCRADPVYSWLRLRGPVHGFCRTIKAEPFHWEFRGKGCVHRTDDGQPIQV